MAAPLGNIFALGNNGGQPPKYNDPEVLKNKVVEYFESYIDCEMKEAKQPVLGHKPTITGLALYLGFESRQSFYDYIKKEEFSYILKKASLYIEMNYEMLLESKAATGAIFALKNMGWNDKSEVDHTTKGESINHISLGSGIKPPTKNETTS